MTQHTESILAFLLVLVISAAAVGQPLNVKVDVDTAYAINGVDQIQSAVFGITAYEGAPWPADPQWREAVAQSGVACLGFVGPIGWAVDPDKKPWRGEDEVWAWFESEAALGEITSAEPLHGRRYMYGQILPACRELGIEPMLYVLGHDYPTADEPYAAEYAGYVSLLKRIDPELRWVHILNEPNAYFYRDDKGGGDYAELFTAVARAIHEKFPEVMVGGPVLCWPPAWPPVQTGKPNWYTWDSWTMPLIRTAGEDLDFFDFHYYGLEVDVAAEEVATVANALYLERGRRIPVAITECGNYMKEEDWADPSTHYLTRTLGMERLLMLYLDRPATVMTVQMHDLHAMAGGAFQFMKSSDPDDQLPTYYLYRLWRHFRGTRVFTRTQRGPIKVMAALNDGTGVCMVFNDQNFSREIEVSLVGLPNSATLEARARWECIYLDKEANELVRASGTGNRFRAQPYSTYAVLFDLPDDWQPTHKAERVESFGDMVMNEFEQVGQHLQVSVNVPSEKLAAARSARVRIGLLGSRDSDRMTMRVGPDTYQLASGTYFQEVQLKRLPPPGKTTLDFCLLRREGTLGERPSEHEPENRLRVSSVSLVIEK